MKTKTTQTLITVVIVALLSVGLYVYATWYVSGLTRKTIDLRNDVANKEIIYKNADNLQRAVQSAADQKTKIAGYFLPADSAITFVSTLERTASNFGLTYTTQNILQESVADLEQQNKELLQVSFSAQGGWSSVMRLLKSIESLPYGMRIDKINLETAGEVTPWAINITFSVAKTKDNARQI